MKARGDRFLARTPNPTGAQWRTHSFWRDIHDDLYNQHNGICMYCASWTPRRTETAGVDQTSVDHFVPRTANANLAYTWTNFRLSRARLNNRKDRFQDVVDPSVIRNEWFSLDFTTFLISPSQNLSSQIEQQVQSTIDRLQLNADNDYVNERVRAVREYCEDRITINQLRTRYPFIASQIVSQDFDTNFRPRLKEIFAQQPRS